MRRLAAVLLAVVMLALLTATAAPAWAAVILPDLQTTFTRALPSDATGVATTPGGAAAYACGSRIILNHGVDISLDRVGSGAWSKYWNGPADKNDQANDVAVSSKGSVYVAGGTQKANGDYKALLLKYSSKGKLLWARTWAGPAGSSPRGLRVAVDPKGRIVVVGQLKVGAAGHVWVARYNADGKRLWAKIHSNGYLGLARDVYVDGAANIYVAGEHQATADLSKDGLLLKYSPSGKQLWRRTYDSPYGQFDTFMAVCRRPGGGVYVAGGSTHSGSDSDGIVMRYSGTGRRTVVARIGENDGAYLGLYDAVVTSDGRVVVGGSTSVGTGASDKVVYSFNAAGDQTWSKTLDSMYILERGERCEFLAAYGDGQVAAAGYWARTLSGDAVMQVVKTHFLDAAGNVVDESTFDGALDGETTVRDVAVKGAYVWVAGQCVSAAPSGLDGFALRFDRSAP